MTRIGINGFGRIGRDYLRSVLNDGELEVVAINDIADSATLARLLRHDSTFGPLPAGRWPGPPGSASASRW